MSVKQCSICLEECTENVHISPCSHTLHLDCMQGLSSLKCPECRIKISNCPEWLKKDILSNRRQLREEQHREQIQLSEQLARTMISSVSEQEQSVPFPIVTHDTMVSMNHGEFKYNVKTDLSEVNTKTLTIYTNTINYNGENVSDPLNVIIPGMTVSACTDHDAYRYVIVME